jgi:catechol 2,3-dioxygenase-like lactoylglutathione lyase family enzyme
VIVDDQDANRLRARSGMIADRAEPGLRDTPAVLPLEAFAGRPIFQIAFVVADLEQGLERYSSVFGLERWRCYRFGASRHTSCEYRGGPTDFTARLALSDGLPQFELVEPGTGRSIHGDWLDERGQGFHHVGIVVDSVAEAVGQMARAGYPVIQAGSGFGAEGDGAYAYFDVHDLGLVVEAVEPPATLGEPDFVWPGAAGSG